MLVYLYCMSGTSCQLVYESWKRNGSKETGSQRPRASGLNKYIAIMFTGRRQKDR